MYKIFKLQKKNNSTNRNTHYTNILNRFTFTHSFVMDIDYQNKRLIKQVNYELSDTEKSQFKKYYQLEYDKTLYDIYEKYKLQEIYKLYKLYNYYKT